MYLIIVRISEGGADSRVNKVFLDRRLNRINVRETTNSIYKQTVHGKILTFENEFNVIICSMLNFIPFKTTMDAILVWK